MNKPDGGPAFPRTARPPHELTGAGGVAFDNTHDAAGMSLRDFFAAAVAPAVLATSFAPPGVQVSAAIVAQGAYILADAMIIEREKTDANKS